MSIANKIMNFIKDERGAECIEYALTSVVIGGGTAAGLTATKDLLQQKSGDMRDAIDVDPT
jgi:Flp pilus assembly pilin Flp